MRFVLAIFVATIFVSAILGNAFAEGLKVCLGHRLGQMNPKAVDANIVVRRAHELPTGGKDRAIQEGSISLLRDTVHEDSVVLLAVEKVPNDEAKGRVGDRLYDRKFSIPPPCNQRDNQRRTANRIENPRRSTEVLYETANVRQDRGRGGFSTFRWW